MISGHSRKQYFGKINNRTIAPVFIKKKYALNHQLVLQLQLYNIKLNTMKINLIFPPD